MLTKVRKVGGPEEPVVMEAWSTGQNEEEVHLFDLGAGLYYISSLFLPAPENLPSLQISFILRKSTKCHHAATRRGIRSVEYRSSQYFKVRCLKERNAWWLTW